MVGLKRHDVILCIMIIRCRHEYSWDENRLVMFTCTTWSSCMMRRVMIVDKRNLDQVNCDYSSPLSTWNLSLSLTPNDPHSSHLFFYSDPDSGHQQETTGQKTGQTTSSDGSKCSHERERKTSGASIIIIPSVHRNEDGMRRGGGWWEQILFH